MTESEYNFKISKYPNGCDMYFIVSLELDHRIIFDIWFVSLNYPSQVFTEVKDYLEKRHEKLSFVFDCKVMGGDFIKMTNENTVILQRDSNVLESASDEMLLESVARFYALPQHQHIDIIYSHIGD